MPGIHDTLDRLLAVEKRKSILKFSAAIAVLLVFCFVFYGGLTATAAISFRMAAVLSTSMAEGMYNRYSRVLAEVDGVNRLMVAPTEFAWLERGELVCIRRADYIIGVTRYSIATDIFCPDLQRRQ